MLTRRQGGSGRTQRDRTWQELTGSSDSSVRNSVQLEIGRDEFCSCSCHITPGLSDNVYLKKLWLWLFNSRNRKSTVIHASDQVAPSRTININNITIKRKQSKSVYIVGCWWTLMSAAMTPALKKQNIYNCCYDIVNQMERKEITNAFIRFEMISN